VEKNLITLHRTNGDGVEVFYDTGRRIMSVVEYKKYVERSKEGLENLVMVRIAEAIEAAPEWLPIPENNIRRNSGNNDSQRQQQQQQQHLEVERAGVSFINSLCAKQCLELSYNGQEVMSRPGNAGMNTSARSNFQNSGNILFFVNILLIVKFY